MHQAYITWNPRRETRQLITSATKILEEFNVTMTVRQLYYQLVAADLIPNNIKSYQRVVRVMRNARMAGLLDWDWIEDRLRVPSIPSTWDDIEALIDSAREAFTMDRWQDQAYYVEIWVEKDALAGICGEACEKWQVALQVNRGYSSASAMREAAKRFIKRKDQLCVIGYLGDHDPSGEDMVRDVAARLELFNAVVDVEKIAIRREDIEHFNLPPQPVKMADSRAEKFRQAHGDDCVELDALRPDVLQARIEDFILDRLDEDLFNAIVVVEEGEKERVKLT